MIFSVMTFNLRFGLADDGPNSWQFRKKALPGLFDVHRTDFICLQEANDFQIDHIAGLLPDYGFIGQRTPAPAWWQNNIIFYRKEWDCVRHDHFYLSETPSVPSAFPESRWPRQCTLGEFLKEGFGLICIDTHFDFDVAVRVKSARLIMQRLSRLADTTPAVLTGDFNAAPASPCYRVFTGQDTDGNCCRPFRDTFKPPFPGTRHGFSGESSGDQIDWILYRGDLLPERPTVIRNTFAGLYPSDHFPLAVVFRRGSGVKSSPCQGSIHQTK